MDILNQLKEIDDLTGDVDACFQLLKEYKKSHNSLYKTYKQYWILVYKCNQDIQSFNECMAIPEIQRVKIISSISPKSISLFSQTALLSCLEYSDTEIHPLISYLWKLLPADLLIQRLLNSQNPSVFYSLPIKINILPEIKSCTSNVYKLLLILASPSLIPLILDLYLQQSQQEYLNKYKKDL